MELTDLTIRIMLLFLPGVLSKVIIDALTVTKDNRPFYFVIYSLLLGFINYVTFSVLVWIYNILPFTTEIKAVIFFESLLNSSVAIDITEIFFVCILSIVVGLGVSKAITKSYLHRFAKRLKIAYKFADKDVWSYMFNSDDVDWISVYDLSNDLIFQGWVEAFSEDHIENEILLRDVKVYDGSGGGQGKELYSSPAMYLHRNKGDLTIELPAIQFTESKTDSTKS